MADKIAISTTALVLILGITRFISAAENWIVSPIISTIAKDFNVSIPQINAILTAYLIPYGIMQPFYVYISDRNGKKKFYPVQYSALHLVL